jgi:hypothetical protein
VDGDLVQRTAAENAQLLEVVTRVRQAAAAAIVNGHPDELTASLLETLELLDGVVRDLVGSRADVAVVYATDPAVRRVVDELASDE